MWWCAIVVWTCTPKCEEECDERGSGVLYFEVHGDVNAAERMVNPPVIAPVTPPARSHAGRPAPSTSEKLPEPGLRQGVVQAEVKLEQEPKAYVAPREREVKQQQYWRPIFVDRPEIETIIERLDDFLSIHAGLYTDGLSWSIWLHSLPSKIDFIQ